MVEIIPGYGRLDEVLALVKEYTDMIAGQGGDVVECPYGIITTNRKSPVGSRVLRFSV